MLVSMLGISVSNISSYPYNYPLKFSTPLPRFWVFSLTRRGTRWDKESKKREREGERRIRLDLPSDLTHLVSFSFFSSTNDVSNHLPQRRNRQQGGAGAAGTEFTLLSLQLDHCSQGISSSLCSVMKLFPQPKRWALVITLFLFSHFLFIEILIKSYAKLYCQSHMGLERSDGGKKSIVFFLIQLQFFEQKNKAFI